MNKTIFFVAFLVYQLISVNTSAQLAQKYLKQLPAWSESVCDASDEVQSKWKNKIYELIKEMDVLIADEKQQIEQAVANAKQKKDVFEPASGDNFEKLIGEIGISQNNFININKEILSVLATKQWQINLKYSSILEPLEQQKSDARLQRKSFELIDKKILEVRKEKCKEDYEARKLYLNKYFQSLNKLIELGEKSNERSDRMRKMMNPGYTYRTQYGEWLFVINCYAGELLKIFDDIPTDENK